MAEVSMAKRLLVFGFILILAALSESAIVVLKNGRIMTGTVVSENENLVVFKDDHGLQFSLKKSSIDLEKTKQANEPPAAPVVPAAVTPPPAPKKDVKVYGQNDLDRKSTR